MLERKAVLKLLEEQPVAENFSSSSEKGVRVGRGTRAFLHGTGPRSTRASLYVGGGSSQRAEGLKNRGTLRGSGLFMRTTLSGGASQVLSHKFCPVRFGVFAL